MHFVWNKIELASKVCVWRGQSTSPHLISSSQICVRQLLCHPAQPETRKSTDLPDVHRVGTGIRRRGKQKQHQAIISSKRVVNRSRDSIIYSAGMARCSLWTHLFEGHLSFLTARRIDAALLLDLSRLRCPFCHSTHSCLLSCHRLAPMFLCFLGFWSEVTSAQQQRLHPFEAPLATPAPPAERRGLPACAYIAGQTEYGGGAQGEGCSSPFGTSLLLFLHQILCTILTYV